jgi:glycerophosphoryl diester phosphodiesterase
MKRVLNIAHRGGAGLWPENTMAALERALAMGCDGMELDVHLSKDGKLVVFHDEALKPEIVRRPDGRWLDATGPLIKDQRYEELRQFDVGRLKPGTKYAERHPDQQPIDGERIPLLEDVIRLTKQRSADAKLWIELKTALLWPERSSTPHQLAEAVIGLLREEDFIDRAVLVAFDWNGLIHAKRLAPEIETRFTTLAQSWFRLDLDGLSWIKDSQQQRISTVEITVANARWLPPPRDHGAPPPPILDQMRRLVLERKAPWEAGHSSFLRPIAKAVREAGGNGWFPFYRDVDPQTAASALELGLTLAAWTVDDPDEMRRLIDLGCDALCTDRPDRLRRVLAPDL